MTSPDSLIQLTAAVQELARTVTAVRIDMATATAELRATREHLVRHEQQDQAVQGDHEQRLRSLSRWRWTMAGVVSLLSAVGIPTALWQLTTGGVL